MNQKTPKNTKNTVEDFFWIQEDAKENCIYIGITQRGLEHCGSVQNIDIQFQLDEVFSEEDTLFIVEGDHQELEWVSEYSGKVVKINPAVVEDSECVNEDPLEEGWIIAIEKEV